MEEKDNETIELKTIIINYLLHWKLFVAAFIISLIPAILYLIYYPVTYEMRAVIQLQEDKEMSGGSFGVGDASGLMKSMGLGSVTVGAINMDDELMMLSSNSLLKKMVLDLGINIEYTEPFSYYRLYENSPYILTTDSLINEQLHEYVKFKVRGKKSELKVTAEFKQGKKTFNFTALPAVMSLPQGDFTLNYTEGFEGTDFVDMNILFQPAGWVAESLVDEIMAEEVTKMSNVIEFSYTDHEKKRGVDMLNKLIEKYNDEANDYKRKDAEKVMRYMDERITLFVDSLKSVERDMAIYKNANNLTDIEHDVLFYVEQLKELQIKLIELESQGHLLKMMNDFINDPDNKYTLVPSLLAQEGETSPIMMYNEVLLERSRVIQNSGINNPLVTTLTKNADQLRKSVFSAITNAQKGLDLTLDDIKSKEQKIYAQMSSFPEHERDFISLKREQEILQGVYLLLLQKREEISLNNGLDKVKAKTLDAAYVMSRPIAPRKLFAALGILLFTIVIPVGYLFLKKQTLSLWDEYRKVTK